MPIEKGVDEEDEDRAGLSQLIPSIYYDLIARITPGVAILTILGWPHRHQFVELSWSGIVLLAGAGYIVGFLLGGVSVPVDLAFRFVMRIAMHKRFRPVAAGNAVADTIARNDRKGAETLFKMHAEAFLCVHLFSGFLVLVTVNWISPFCPMLYLSRVSQVLLIALLGVCVFQRLHALVAREERFLTIHELDWPSASNKHNV